MADFQTSAARRPTITIGDVNGDEHPFEVLPFTTSRMKATVKFTRAMRDLQAAALESGGTADQVEELQRIVAESIDDRVKSLNGGTTISDLVRDELIEFRNVRQIGEFLQKEAVGDPPA